jgi:endonuclease/exonuclease/phosphatase family metal-dependent hydrolase
MKTTPIVLAGLTLWCSAARSHVRSELAEPVVAVMSFNIRMNYQDDGPNNWEHRRDWMADLVNYHKPALLGTQETFYPQYVDLKERLPEYDSFGPVEGRQGAESVAIFYLKSHYELVASGTFWLSPTPETQSLGWDAALRRVVTWGEFATKTNNLRVFFFATHFDHMGNTARKESVNMLLQQVHEIAGRITAFIAGDFNLRPDSDYYTTLTAGTDGLPRFYDTRTMAEEPYGPPWTIHNFGKTAVDERPRIDYIFTNKELEVLEYVNISEQRGDVFPSDHNPQMATIRLK